LDVISRSPLVLQNIQANPAGEIDIRVVDRCLEENGGWSIWVVRWECEGELERKVGVWGIIWSFDGRSPRKKVAVGRWESRYSRSRGCHELHELGLKSIHLSEDEKMKDEDIDEPFSSAVSILRTLRSSKLRSLRGWESTRRGVLRILHFVVHY